MPINIDEVKEAARAKLSEADHKFAVEEELMRLRAKRPHFFPKRIRFQWPIRFEDWYNPKCR